MDTIIVASRLPVPLRITEPHPNKEKPGEAPELRSHVIVAAGHPGSIEEGITRDVPADLFHAWMDANPHHPAVHGNLLREVSEEDLKKGVEFGWEPNLKRLSEDGKNTEAAAKGSQTTSQGAVKAEDMAAHSDAPNDDSPRSQTESGFGAGTGTAAVAPVPLAPPSPQV